MKSSKIGIIGCGNMGAAIVKAVAGQQSPVTSQKSIGRQTTGRQADWRPADRRTVTSYDVDEKKHRDIAKRHNTKKASSAAELVRDCDIIILAVKPQDIEGLMGEISPELAGSKVLISIAAGVSTSYLERAAAKKVAVIRVMPNMPALVGGGISAICKGRSATYSAMAQTKAIFNKVGEVVEVKEDLMDAVTAISGSGPAYFFYLVEVLIKAGVDLGLKRAVAAKLAVETILGSARILKETGEDPALLRARVTSKGGTTEAAFNEFFAGDIQVVLEKGIRKAFERSRHLCKS